MKTFNFFSFFEKSNSFWTKKKVRKRFENNGFFFLEIHHFIKKSPVFFEIIMSFKERNDWIHVFEAF